MSSHVPLCVSLCIGASSATAHVYLDAPRQLSLEQFIPSENHQQYKNTADDVTKGLLTAIETGPRSKCAIDHQILVES
ncbi:hypothetical protein GGR57DRAFT_465260 [Xylariaceae sp. FL1272]|nr:hypothetical protein GGR57DRAFT_465260 [Xylariaceae sp. FL1272]